MPNNIILTTNCILMTLCYERQAAFLLCHKLKHEPIRQLSLSLVVLVNSHCGLNYHKFSKAWKLAAISLS